MHDRDWSVKKWANLNLPLPSFANFSLLLGKKTEHKECVRKKATKSIKAIVFTFQGLPRTQTVSILPTSSVMTKLRAQPHVMCVSRNCISTSAFV